jgi:hypothetical protein
MTRRFEDNPRLVVFLFLGWLSAWVALGAMAALEYLSGMTTTFK